MQVLKYKNMQNKVLSSKGLKSNSVTKTNMKIVMKQRNENVFNMFENIWIPNEVIVVLH
jgi:hypothetical protein